MAAMYCEAHRLVQYGETVAGGIAWGPAAYLAANFPPEGETVVQGQLSNDISEAKKTARTIFPFRCGVKKKSREFSRL